MVISSSDHSSSSSKEDSKTPRPEIKISTSEARAKIDRSLKDAKEIINGTPLDFMKVVCDGFLKREAKDEKLATYQQKRRRLQRKRLEVEDEIRSRADGVASDSDAKVESVWEPIEREVKPYPPGMRAERLAKADFRAECEEDEHLDAMYADPEDQLKGVLNEDSDDDSEEELEEDYTDDDREDDDGYDEPDDYSCLQPSRVVDHSFFVEADTTIFFFFEQLDSIDIAS
ncbi:glutamic acid-rich protein-like [Papaver somniferum]|uniref:glutamic acid-rich protein-like n=1 Tax=Papaver somniferum TaxID=3469 RepID=UPI000E6FFC03|nr:glutamic acid-rich protein-like [Papaver somniferum]